MAPQTLLTNDERFDLWIENKNIIIIIIIIIIIDQRLCMLKLLKLVLMAFIQQFNLTHVKGIQGVALLIFWNILQIKNEAAFSTF